METIGLKKDIIKEVKKDPILFGRIMECLGKRPAYGIQLLNNNDPMLTQAAVLRILCEHLNIGDQGDLLEVILDSNDNNNIENPQLQASH